MYIPKSFEVTDRATLFEFIESHSFGTLISVLQGSPFASRIPFLLDRGRGPSGTLAGHVARANPHWRSFDATSQSLAIFDGPHAYISPAWYATSPAVPTWNYATVHVYGRPRAIDDPDWLSALVDRMVVRYESPMAQPWPGILPDEFRARLLKAIVGFQIEIERIEGKFKLGQNRPVEDQMKMLSYLEESTNPDALQLAAMSKAHLK